MRVGVDIGGTYTDALALDDASRVRILSPDASTAVTGAAWLGATPWQR